MANDTPQATQTTPDFSGLRYVPIDQEPTYDTSKQQPNPKDIHYEEPLQLQPSTNKTLPSAVQPLPTPKDIGKTTVEGVNQTLQGVGGLMGADTGTTVQQDVHNVVSGAIKAGTVPMMFAAAVDPLLLAQGIAESTAGGYVARKGAEELGASPENQQLAEDIGAVAVPIAIHGLIPKRLEGSAFDVNPEKGSLSVGVTPTAPKTITEEDKTLAGDPFNGLRVQEEPNIVYRARPEGQEGITVSQGSHAHATASESEAHGYRQNMDEMSANEGKNVTHKVDAIDLSKIPSDQYKIMKGPNGHDWVRFNQDQPESIFNKAEEKPTKINFVRNPEKAPDVGERFGQHLEPAGRYINESTEGISAPKGWETGTVEFKKPLTIDWGGGYQEPTNWKKVLSDRYDGKTGQALSDAIRKDGYDGIITKDKYGTNEIVDLTKPAVKEPAEENPKMRGLVERSTGNPEHDAQIKAAGAIPAGNSVGLSMFHDPKTGSTLAIKPENLTPDALQKQLSESRKAFGVKESVKEPVSEGDTSFNFGANVKPEDIPADHWSNKAAENIKNNNGFSYNPITGEAPKSGYMVEVHPESRKVFDHPATPQDIRDFADEHKDLFEKNPELHVGGYGKELNVSGNLKVAANVQDLNAAKQMGKSLDQKSIWDVKNQKEISTGGTGTRTNFENYPIEERMSDLRGQTEMGPAGHEHLPKRLYDYMEPDERDFVKGNKTRQQNITTAYRNIRPSLEETTNSMNAGAMNAGWWQRFMDTFGIVGGVDKDTGVSHTEALKQWHSGLSGNKNVQDAANLAGHSYADWLDAGKPTDRKSINDIIKKNGAQPAGSAKKGNAAMSDTIDKNGKVTNEGIDTTKILNLVNSPEMRGEKPFTGEAFGGTNPLRGVSPGAIKIPSMGATTAGKGNLNRLVLDAHGLDFYGMNGWTDATYIAHSIHMRHAAEALDLKGGEGQEQQWGVILGLKELLKEGKSPEEAAKGITDNFILQKGKDYAKIIKDDPESNAIFERLKKYGTKGATEIQSGLDKIIAERPTPREETGVNQTLLANTAARIRESISPSKIKGAPKASASENKAAGWLEMMKSGKGMEGLGPKKKP